MRSPSKPAELRLDLGRYEKGQLDRILMTLLCNYGASHVSLAQDGSSVTVTMQSATREIEVREAVEQAAATIT